MSGWVIPEVEYPKANNICIDYSSNCTALSDNSKSNIPVVNENR